MRPIDGDALKHNLENAKENAERAGKQIYSEIFNTFIDWVERMPTLTQPNGWISVNEKLPEEGYEHKCLLYTPRDGVMCVGYYDGKDNWNNRDRWMIVTAMRSTKTLTKKVTHWMPLPAPPKEGQS